MLENVLILLQSLQHKIFVHKLSTYMFFLMQFCEVIIILNLKHTFCIFERKKWLRQVLPHCWSHLSIPTTLPSALTSDFRGVREEKKEAIYIN